MPWTPQKLRKTLSKPFTKRHRYDGGDAKKELSVYTGSSSSEEYCDAEEEQQEGGTLDKDHSEDKKIKPNEKYPLETHEHKHNTKDDAGNISNMDIPNKFTWGNTIDTGQNPVQDKPSLTPNSNKEEFKRAGSYPCVSKADFSTTNPALNHKSKTVNDLHQQHSFEPPSYSDEDAMIPAPLPGEMTSDQPSTTDGKSGKSCQEQNQHSETRSSGWLSRLGSWFDRLGYWFGLLGLFGWLRWFWRKPKIYICTSRGIDSVQGLREKLQTLSDPSNYEIQVRELPFSNLKDFTFSSDEGKSDAMILCHSVQNRGFAITDVPNSIYEEYLEHCYEVFGKNHVVLIVHDFDFKTETLKGQMEIFQKTQPKTFELAGHIALAGKLDTDVQLCQDDLTHLENFVKKFC